jgi:spore maturation protein B
MTFSQAIIPLLLAAVVTWGCVKKVPVFDCFLGGVKDGIGTTARLLPTLLGLLVAVNALRASGFTADLARWLSPATQKLGIPSEIVPLALLRPLSGSGSLALLKDTLATHGADSTVGQIAAVLQASTETTFYTLTVYFGHCHIKRTRHALAAATTGDMMSVLAAVLAVRLLLA